MVAFLEKQFEFTTTLSMNECVARLEAKSKRGSGWLASKRDILVRISDDGDGKKFSLDRDVGRNLYAEVFGKIQKDGNGSVHVKGFGRIPLSMFLFICLGAVWICILAYAMRTSPGLSAWAFLPGIFLLIFWIVTVRNRNDLIKIVYQTLDSSNDI